MADDELLTLDELTRRVGLTVRNVRFYTTRGLVPPPINRGRSGYYSSDHVARLELVQELQAHGFTLAAIEQYVAGIPDGASPGDIALRRSMLAPWHSDRPVTLDRAELDLRADRALSEDEMDILVALGVVHLREDGRLRRRALAAVARPRPARPRLPGDRRPGRAGGVRAARPRDRARAARRVPAAGVAGLPGGRREPGDRAGRGGAAQAALDRLAGGRLRGGHGRDEARGDRPKTRPAVDPPAGNRADRLGQRLARPAARETPVPTRRATARLRVSGGRS